MSNTSYLAKNLEFLMNKKGLNANSLQDKAGITQSTTSRILNGTTRNPRDSVLKQYVDFFGIDMADLRYKDLSKEIETEPLPANLDMTLSAVSEWNDETPLETDEVAIPFYKDVSFACGSGSVNYEDYGGRKLRMGKYTLRNLGVSFHNAFAATACDDSMTPYIQDGDTIFIDRGRTTIKDGRIFAIRHGELHYCKRLYRNPDGSIRVVSDNSEEFPEKTVSKADLIAGNFEVIGWVFSVSRLERW